ncbi:hypothetical protein PM082_021811 [Marasmius tenuissimus]|nr:hypothetical protein PM082_021811 [Marasmius tenuissimus]
MLLHLLPPRRSPLAWDEIFPPPPTPKNTTSGPAAKLPEEIVIIVLKFLISDHHPPQEDLPCEIRRVLQECSLISPAWLRATRLRLFEHFPVVPKTEKSFQGLRRIFASPYLTIDCNEVKVLDVKGNVPVHWTRPPTERERVQVLTDTLDNFLNWVARNFESGGPTFANLRELRLSKLYFCSSLPVNSGKWVVLTHRTQYSRGTLVPCAEEARFGTSQVPERVSVHIVLGLFSCDAGGADIGSRRN